MVLGQPAVWKVWKYGKTCIKVKKIEATIVKTKFHLAQEMQNNKVQDVLTYVPAS